MWCVHMYISTFHLHTNQVLMYAAIRILYSMLSVNEGGGGGGNFSHVYICTIACAYTHIRSPLCVLNLTCSTRYVFLHPLSLKGVFFLFLCLSTFPLFQFSYMKSADIVMGDEVQCTFVCNKRWCRMKAYV